MIAETLVTAYLIAVVIAGGWGLSWGYDDIYGNGWLAFYVLGSLGIVAFLVWMWSVAWQFDG